MIISKRRSFFFSAFLFSPLYAIFSLHSRRCCATRVVMIAGESAGINLTEIKIRIEHRKSSRWLPPRWEKLRLQSRKFSKKTGILFNVNLMTFGESKHFDILTRFFGALLISI